MRVIYNITGWKKLRYFIKPLITIGGNESE
jgi:hypothetical protein